MVRPSKSDVFYLHLNLIIFHGKSIVNGLMMVFLWKINCYHSFLRSRDSFHYIRVVLTSSWWHKFPVHLTTKSRYLWKFLQNWCEIHMESGLIWCPWNKVRVAFQVSPSEPPRRCQSPPWFARTDARGGRLTYVFFLIKKYGTGTSNCKCEFCHWLLLQLWVFLP